MNIDAEINRLEQCFVTTVNSFSDSSFFLNLFSYMDVFEHSSLLQELVKNKVQPILDSDLENWRGLKLAVWEEGDTIVKELLSNELVSKSILPEVCQYRTMLEQFVNKELLVSGDDTENLVARVNRLLIALVNCEDLILKEIALKYAVLGEYGNIINWSWSKSYDKYDTEDRRIKRIREMWVWFQYSELVYAYETYMKHEVNQEMLWKQGQRWRAWNNAEAFRELDEIIKNGSKDKPLFFIRETYERYLKSVYSFFRYLLLDIRPVDISSNKTEDLRYNLEQTDWPNDASFIDGRLTVGGREILVFSKGNRRDIFEKLFLANGRGMSVKAINDPYICKPNDLKRTIRAINDDRLAGTKCVKIESDKNRSGTKYRVFLKP